MCLRTCFDQGSCGPKVMSRVINDIWVSDDGNVLTYRAPKKTESRSFYKGDSSWKKDGLTYVVTEYHNIDRACLKALRTWKGRGRTCMLTRFVHDHLKNPRIYQDLVNQRMRSLERHGYVVQTKGGEWFITPKGTSFVRKDN